MTNRFLVKTARSKFSLILLAFVFFTYLSKAQTPGMIFENLGNHVLDPNGDGFISKSTTGFSAADKFANQQSEIPFVPFAVVQMEPTEDPGPGPNCFFNDFDDIREYGEPMYSYFDQNTSGGPYLLYRFRLAGYAPNSKSYSVFIDIDGRFGDPAIVGASAGDPNYTAENPGFEVEIYLATNFGVGIYNIDGVHAGTSSDGANVDARDGTFPYEDFAQKAVAWKYTGGSCSDGQEYFYDFYIPWRAVSALTFDEATIAGGHITTTTPLRMVGATIMNPNPGFNKGLANASLSDWGGIDSEGTPEELVTDLINVFPPTTAEDIDDNQRIAPRSDCPFINTPITGSTSVTGSSSEDDGTNIVVYVADNREFNSAVTYTTTVSGGTWTVTVPELITGYYVKATAQNPAEVIGSVTISESVSFDDCDVEQVINSCDDNKTPAVINVEKINGRKGFKGQIPNPNGHLMEIAIYDTNGNLFDLGALPEAPNPALTRDINWEIQADQSGGSFEPGIYYIVSRDLTLNICPSDYEFICMSDNNGDYRNAASDPIINGGTVISPSETMLTGTTNGESGSTVQVYINGAVQEAVVTGSSWTLDNLTFQGCENIEVVQYITQAGSAECVSGKAIATVGQQQPPAPVVDGAYCAGTGVAVSGTANADDGTVIQLLANGSEIGSTTLRQGKWAVYGLTLSQGQVLSAKIPAGSCSAASDESAGVTVGSPTSASGLAIDNTTVEGATSVKVTVPAGGPYTVRLYIDYYNEDAWTAVGVNGGTTHTFTGLSDSNGRSLIYAGARLTASVEAVSACESDLSAEFEVPCDPSLIEDMKTITAETPVCANTPSSIVIENSQKGVMYQVYDAANNPIGYTAAGNGGAISVSTGNLPYGGTHPDNDVQSFTVRAMRMVPTSSSCEIELNGGNPVVVEVRPDVGPVNLELVAQPEPTAICSGNTFDVTIAGAESGISYQLLHDITAQPLSDVLIGTGADLTITSYAINNTGNIPVKVRASNGSCHYDLETVIGVQIKDSPVITGNLSVCQGDVEMYSTEAGMTNYVWSVTGGTITGANGTNSISVTWQDVGSRTITVNYDESVCGTTMDVQVADCSNTTPVANNDLVQLYEDNGAVNILVLADNGNGADDFGADGPSTGALVMVSAPENGVAMIHTNGTANNPADDYVVYTPNANYNGPDGFTYEICDANGDCAVATVNLTIVPVNDEPSFMKGDDQLLDENTTGLQIVNSWGSGQSTGPANEALQSLSFIASSDNNELFTTQPTIDAAGNLSYELAPDQWGVALVSVYVQDNGGIADGGDDTSAPQTFTITVNSVPKASIAVDKVTILEANEEVATFTVSLNHSSDKEVTVNLKFIGSAVVTQDYTGGTDVVVFAPGETSKNVLVTAVDDNLCETGDDETLIVSIDSVVNGVENGDQVTETSIIDKNVIPLISISGTSDPLSCGANGTIALNLTNVADGSYLVTHADGDFGTVAVTAGSATLNAPAGTYTDIQIMANGCVSALGIQAVLNAPAAPEAPLVGSITQPDCETATGSVVLSNLPAGNWVLNPG
uniref:Ig-like domain-containing protein n=1 Tax=Carboxylicivirga taeanensis TaxID=1416875 RepID=UPI003F6E33BB